MADGLITNGRVLSQSVSSPISESGGGGERDGDGEGEGNGGLPPYMPNSQRDSDRERDLELGSRDGMVGRIRMAGRRY